MEAAPRTLLRDAPAIGVLHVCDTSADLRFLGLLARWDVVIDTSDVRSVSFEASRGRLHGATLAGTREPFELHVATGTVESLQAAIDP